MGTLNCKNCNCKNQNNNNNDNDNERNDLDGDGNAKCNEIGEMRFPQQQSKTSQFQWEITTKSNNQLECHYNNEQQQTKDGVNMFITNYGGTNIQSNHNMDSRVTEVNDVGDSNKVACKHANRKDIYSNQSDVLLGMEVNDDDNYNLANKDIEHHVNINSASNCNNSNALFQKQNEIKTEREDELCYSNINLDNNININSNCDDIYCHSIIQ